MKIRKITYLIGLVAAVLMAGCTKEVLVTEQGQEGTIDDPTGTPVLFTVGNLNEAATTRSTIPYMAQNGRFVCTMYYHSGKSDTDDSDYDIKHPANGGTMTTAWLKVNNTVGNSVYRKNTFVVDNEGTDIDAYGFDKTSTNFYWQNRLTHAFLALTDYNKLSTIDGDTTETKEDKLKMYPHYDKDMRTLPATGATHDDSVTYANTAYDNRYVNSYDLTKGTKTSISQQPDPILALTIMKPAGSTQEANRVRLYFKHQFSQIQVNLKGAADESTELTSEQIDKVELLGVTEKGYVCCRLNAGGTVGDATYEAINLESYTDEQLANNKWGTSFNMFDMATGTDEDGDGTDDGYAAGYLKSFNAIAYGMLWAIRIHWHEGTTEDTGVEHVSTYEVPEATGETEGNIPLRQLQSGRKYIYNLELRRGTLAVIRTQIIDWYQDEELVYSSDGTIYN